MATPVIMPKQGQSVETCIISQWFKKKGEAVKTGDLLFAYETDKASFEEEAKADGVLLEIFFNEGDEVPVLSTVAVLGTQGESVPAADATPTIEAVIPEPVATEVTSSEPAGVPTVAAKTARLRISPRAKAMAIANNIDPYTIIGSGPNGRIISKDVEHILAAGKSIQKFVAVQKPVVVVASSDAESEVTPLTNIRKVIARAMHASLQNSAQLTHHLGADVRKLLSFRNDVKKSMNADPGYPNITLNDMVCWCVIRALEKFPQVNSHFLGDSIRTFHSVNLGMAVDTPRGLMVPVLKNADEFSLKGLCLRLKELAEACRKGSVNPDLLASDAGSFTVSNLGGYGVEMFTPIINLPQVAILGVNTIVHRPADIGGVMGLVPYIGLSLTYDHRAIDGGPATLFLAEIKKNIETFNL